MHTMYDFVKEREQAMFEEGQIAGEKIGEMRGEKRGRLEGIQSTAVKMLTKGMAPELIQELTGLTEEELKKLDR